MYDGAVTRPEGPLPLPPLNALRAFEAAARHASFTRAADELCVTQTAVSHQIRALEDHLGASLFERQPRSLVLTDAGRKWAAALHPIFAALHAANRSLRTPMPASRPGLSITILPSFASHWLVPRLGSFLAAHPDIDLHLSPSSAVVDLSEGAFDLAIRYGPGRYPGSSVESLCGDAWIPACAPTFEGRRSLRHVRDLRRFRLLHDDERAWERWLSQRGVAHPDARRGPVLTDSSMVVDAAVRGQGVGLVRLSLAADALADGRLVRLFPRIAPLATAHRYYLVQPRTRSPRPAVDAFITWLRRELATLQALGL